MIKSILAATDGSPYGDTACAYAMDLAKRLEARLMGLHVLDSRMLEGPLMADLSGWIGAQPYSAQLRQFRELMEQKGQTVIDAFTARCEEEGLTPEVWLKMGHPVRVILEQAARAEMLVLGQKGEHAAWIDELMGSNADRIAHRCVKPCLVTPEKFESPGHILAAYDGSSHAGKALQEAIELAAALKTALTVFVAAESEEDTSRAEEAARTGRKMASDHGVEADVHVAGPGHPGEAAIEVVEEKGCDLIVVGPYGHNRLRRWLAGSTTSHLLNHARKPVLVVR